jgi:hypothetical protein
MKLKIIFSIVALIGAALPTFANAAIDARGNFNGYLGMKYLDDEDWGENDDQVAVGISFDMVKQNWPFNLVMEGIVSSDSHDSGPIDTTSSIIELAVGARKYFDFTQNMSLYAGLGPTLFFGMIDEDGVRLAPGPSLENADRDDSGAGVGAWVGGGLIFRPNERLNFGLNIRQSWGEVEIFNRDREAGGLLVNLLGGVRF